MRAKWTVKLDGRIIGTDEQVSGEPGQTLVSAVSSFNLEVNGKPHPVEVTVEFDPPPVVR